MQSTQLTRLIKSIQSAQTPDELAQELAPLPIRPFWDHIHKPEETGDEESEPPMLAELERGEIPDLIIEVAKLIPLNDPALPAFQAEMLDWAKFLFPEHDFVATPIRFLISDLGQGNACYMNGAEPLTFVIDRSLFDLNRPRHLKSVDQFVGILLHEAFHHGFSRDKKDSGPLGSSKQEEAAADLYAVKRMVELGFNPRAFVDWFRLEQRPSPGWIDLFERLFSPHPLNESRISYLEAEMTVLERGGGKLPEALSSRSLETLKEITASVRHHSYIDQRLESAQFHSLSLNERFGVLQNLYNEAKLWEHVRHEDLCLELRKFVASAPEAEKDHFVNFLLDLVCEYDQGKAFADDTQSSDYEFRWWRLLARSLRIFSEKQANETFSPIGRLKKLALHLQNFVSATEPDAMRQAAQSIISAVADEPLCSSGSVSFLFTLINWPGFSVPSKLGEVVSWNSHAVQAIADIRKGDYTIASALRECAVEDYRIYQQMSVDGLVPSLRKARIQEIDHHTGKGYAGTFPPQTHEISLTDDFGATDSPEIFNPRKVSALAYDWDNNGCIINMPASHSDVWRIGAKHNQKRFKHFATEENITYLCSLLDSKSAPSVQSIADLVKMLPPRDTLIDPENLFDKPALFQALNPLGSRGFLDLARNKQSQVEAVLRTRLAGKTSETLSDSEKSVVLSIIDEECGFGCVISDYLGSKHTDCLLDWPLMRLAIEDPWEVINKKDRIRRLFLLGESAVKKSELELILPLAKNLLPPALLEPIKSWEELAQRAESVLEFAEQSRLFFGLDYQLLQTSKLLIGASNEPIKRFAAFVCELALLDAKSLPAPTLAQLVRYFNLVDQPLVFFEPCPQAIIGLFYDQFFKSRSYSDDLPSAAREWQTVRRVAHYIKKEALEDDLKVLLTKANSPSLATATKLEFFQEIITGEIIDSIDLRRLVRAGWASAFLEHFGPDDMSESYLEAIRPEILRTKQFKSFEARAAGLKELAKKLTAQSSLASLIEKTLRDQGKEIVFDSVSEFEIILTEARLAYMNDKPELRREMLNFLRTPLTDDSIKELAEKDSQTYLHTIGNYSPPEYAKTETSNELVKHAKYRRLHQLFWDFPLEGRALICRQIAFPVGDQTPEAETFDLVINHLLDTNSAYANKIRAFIHEYLTVLVDDNSAYQKPVLMAALLSSAEPGQNRSFSTGQSIATLGAALGPGENKSVQTMHSHHATPKEMRRGMGDSKYKIAEPAFWELHKRTDEVVPQIVRDQITYRGKILGCASFQISEEVEMLDGSTQVLQVERAKSRERAEYGCRLLSETVKRLADKDPTFTDAVEMIEESRKAWLNEIDPQLARAKLLTMDRLFNGLSIIVDRKVIKFEAPTIYRLASGELAQGPGYRIISKIPGQTLAKLIEDKSKLAEIEPTIVASLAADLVYFLRGLEADDDGHSGNVLYFPGRVGRVDAGGIGLDCPTEAELSILGEVLAKAIVNEGQNIQELSTGLFDQVRSRKSLGQPVPHLVRRFQRFCLRFSEYGEFLSERRMFQILRTGFEYSAPSFRAGFMAHANRSLSMTTKILLGPKPFKIIFPEGPSKKRANEGPSPTRPR